MKNNLNQKNKKIYHIYNGFCPIFWKILEKMLEKGWTSMKDILKELSGEYEYPQDESEVISTKADK